MDFVTKDTQHLSMNQLHDWLGAANGGQTVVYAIGDIAYSCHPIKEAAELCGVRDIAMGTSEAHLGYLSQRRIVEKVFEYRLTKASDSKTAWRFDELLRNRAMSF